MVLELLHYTSEANYIRTLLSGSRLRRTTSESLKFELTADSLCTDRYRDVTLVVTTAEQNFRELKKGVGGAVSLKASIDECAPSGS